MQKNNEFTRNDWRGIPTTLHFYLVCLLREHMMVVNKFVFTNTFLNYIPWIVTTLVSNIVVRKTLVDDSGVIKVSVSYRLSCPHCKPFTHGFRREGWDDGGNLIIYKIYPRLMCPCDSHRLIYHCYCVIFHVCHNADRKTNKKPKKNAHTKQRQKQKQRRVTQRWRSMNSRATHFKVL